MKCVAVLAVLSVATVGAHTVGVAGAHTQLRKDRSRSQGFVRALAFQYSLRICNGFPSESQLAVFKGKEDLTKDAALPYKACKDYKPELKSGDKIDFKFDGSEAGTFTITDLPQNDATLLLVVHRHDTHSSTVSFESHVFANLANAQIAVIDSYSGGGKSTVKIQDSAATKQARQEELRYDSVVAVNPGDYECVLYAEDGSVESKARLVALPKESYTVLRMGVDDPSKPYKPELVVYPQSDDSSLKSAAGRIPALAAVLLALAAVLLVQ